MDFDATKEVNKRYEEFSNGKTSLDVPSFEEIPIFGENIDSYMKYVRENSVLSVEPTNAIGKVMRKVNRFWFNPIIVSQDKVNKSIITILEEYYKANKTKKQLNAKLLELNNRLNKLEGEG